MPGSPLDPRCRGCNDLLRQGATLTETAADVLAQLGPLLHGADAAAPRRPPVAICGRAKLAAVEHRRSRSATTPRSS